MTMTDTAQPDTGADAVERDADIADDNSIGTGDVSAAIEDEPAAAKGGKTGDKDSPASIENGSTTEDTPTAAEDGATAEETPTTAEPSRRHRMPCRPFRFRRHRAPPPHRFRHHRTPRRPCRFRHHRAPPPHRPRPLAPCRPLRPRLSVVLVGLPPSPPLHPARGPSSIAKTFWLVPETQREPRNSRATAQWPGACPSGARFRPMR